MTTRFLDASRLIIEALVRAGAQAFVGYPITPANRLYAYASKRFPVFLPAPDEISALQWAAGYAATGKFAVTATSFPGFALMLETLNMAFMMELPMVVILAQRMGPSTGSATTGAQGDLLLLRGAISGGYVVPVFCPSNFEDCWLLAERTVRTANDLRSPVILLTSKEMLMTNRSFDTHRLPPISSSRPSSFVDNGAYEPYAASGYEVPPFLPVGSSLNQVRLNASTHDRTGLIRKATQAALANTRRLHEKTVARADELAVFDYEPSPDAGTLVVTYGVTAEAAREAVAQLQAEGSPVSLLVAKTLIPVSPALFDIFSQYERLIFAEENLTGSFCEMCFGQRLPERVSQVTNIGRMIKPSEIIAETAR